MKTLLLIPLLLMISFAPIGAGEIASGTVGFVRVEVDAETVVELMADEVQANDFARLMPEAGASASSGAVHSVTLEEAITYAVRLTELNRRLGVLGAEEELRLPTLEEWMAVAGAPLQVRSDLMNLGAGLREFCADTKVETFPSREDLEKTVEHVFVAVAGAHDQLEPDERRDAQERPGWIREETRSPVVGFRLVRSPVEP